MFYTFHVIYVSEPIKIIVLYYCILSCQKKMILAFSLTSHRLRRLKDVKLWQNGWSKSETTSGIVQKLVLETVQNSR